MLGGAHTDLKAISSLGLKHCIRYLDIPGALLARGRSGSERGLGKPLIPELSLENGVYLGWARIERPTAPPWGILRGFETCFYYIF